jgi:hypothetical protein
MPPSWPVEIEAEKAGVDAVTDRPQNVSSPDIRATFPSPGASGNIL